MPFETLFGSLDPTTRSWTDGIFVHILRTIIQNLQGELDQVQHRFTFLILKIHWIVFNGDVDPEWVENLNALLDDNKLVTLPTGERLELPSCVRVFFEVDNLDYATPATVSRCGMNHYTPLCDMLGMVYFNDDTIDRTTLYTHFLKSLGQVPLDPAETRTGTQSPFPFYPF
jgi:dynein heavy chain 1